MSKRIIVTHRWAGTDLLQISVPIIGAHDEATHIARVNAMEAFAEGLGLVCGVPIEDAEPTVTEIVFEDEQP
jgi:hypothetical protein